MALGKILGVPKNVFVLGLVSLFNDASSDMVYPLIPVFLTTTLGASFLAVGVIEGIAESTASLLKIASGYLSDRVGRRKLLTGLGYGISALAKPVLAFASAPWHVLLVRFADRFGKGVRVAPRDAIITFYTPLAIRGRAFGLHRAMDTAGAVIGPLLAVLFLGVFAGNLRPIFLLAFVGSAVSVLLLWFFVQDVGRGFSLGSISGGARSRSARGASASLESRATTPSWTRLDFSLFDRRFKIFLLGVTLFSLANFSDAFLLLKAKDAGLAIVGLPLVYLLSNLVLASFSTSAGIWADRIGPKKVLVTGYLIFVAVFLGLAVTHTTAWLWPLFALYGLSLAATEGVTRAFASVLVPAEIRGTAFGVLHAAIGFSLLPAAVIAGALWQTISPQAPFVYGAALAMLAALIIGLVPSVRMAQEPVTP